MRPGGSAKENPSRAWGGGGAGFNTCFEDSGWHSVPAFAGNVSCDHTRIDCETPIFYTREVHPGNSEIAFVVNGHPSIDSSGCLTFGLQANFYGKVQFGVALSFAGSQFQSNLSFFSISVIPVNDKPVFLLSSNNIHVSEDDFSARIFTQPGFISESFLEPFSQLDMDGTVESFAAKHTLMPGQVR